LLQPIGRGAYGEVWLARNLVGTLRAVKVVYRQDFGDAQPFDREFKGMRRFEPVSRSHPGLVNILQIGRNDAGGYFYYVMELADAAAEGADDQCSVTSDQASVTSGQCSVISKQGSVTSDQSQSPGTAPASLNNDNSAPITPYIARTLRHDLRTRGRLPATECVELALALTSALQHLHQDRLVHRDIKPSNIIFVNGRPKLADIGLVTEAGDSQSIVGTEGYLPPEGPGTVAADLYSLGKVFYEISTGEDRRKFPDLPTELKGWPDSRALLQLNEVVLKACAKDVARRYHSAEEMHADLLRLQAGKPVRWRRKLEQTGRQARRFGPALAVGALALLLLPRLMPPQSAQPTAVSGEKASVFVLPFRTEGTNAVADDLRRRITDAFIDSLALIDGVRRSPRRSGWVNQDEDELRRSLARTNDMRHILTGRTSGGGDRLTLTLRLFEPESDNPVWTETFPGTTNEVAALERRAVGRIASTLRLRVTETEQRQIDQLLANNLEALGWLRQARDAYDRKAGTQVGYAEVQRLAQKALELDPAYLDADFKDIEVLRDLALDRAPRESWPGIRLRLENILKEDETHAGALDQMGGYLLSFARDWVALAQVVERELAARDSRSRDWLAAMWFRAFGWFEEARIWQERSEHPEPTVAAQLVHMGYSRRVDRRYADGARVARRLLDLYPGNSWGYFSLAHCLVAAGEFEQGLEAIRKAQEIWQGQEMTALKGYAYARMGQPDKAREVVPQLLDLRRAGHYVQPYFVARIYAALSENQEALDWLEKAEADRSEYLLFADVGGLRTDPAWDGLQNEPRYWRLCERLGLGKNQWPRPRTERLP
jgi:serine/threonine protein kinase/tetratricopeptide (TPR) repeat protein